MAYNEKLAGRIRRRLADVPKVQEVKMMGGLTAATDLNHCSFLRLVLFSIGGDAERLVNPSTILAESGIPKTGPSRNRRVSSASSDQTHGLLSRKRAFRPRVWRSPIWYRP